VTPKLTLTASPTSAQRRAIVDPLVEFNETQAGPENYRPLAILVSDAATDNVVGGLWGSTANSYLHIDLLFLPNELRRIGLGRRLMKDAEEEAIRRGCRGAWLDTYSFQARGFYERIGYAVFGAIPDYPPGHSRFFLMKALSSGAS
jgi:GNAT superfamily N-acetyltransferase